MAARKPSAPLPLPDAGPLFEDHKIARTTFHLPEGTLRVSTRAFLVFLEEKGWLASAAEVEHEAIRAGRAFSRLRFP